MTGHDENTPAGGTPRVPPAGAAHPAHDGVDDPALHEVAEEVYRVLHDQPRPAFRDRLRAQLIASHAEMTAGHLGGARPGLPGFEPTAGTAGGTAPSTPGPASGYAPGTPGPASGYIPGPAHSTAPAGATGSLGPTAGRPTTRRPQPDPGPGPRRPGPRPGPTPFPSGPGRVSRRRRSGGRRRMAWTGTVAAAVIAAALLVVAGPWAHRSTTVSVAAQSASAGALSADPNAPVQLTFSQPLDHTATQAALRLSPATSVRSSWRGDTLAISPVNGFAPNSAYVLTIDHRVARASTGAPLAGDLQVAFGTAPTLAGARTAVTPVALSRTAVASATDGAEAVVTVGGSLLVTAATGPEGGLVRLTGDQASTISAATDAICVSRSGQSIAFLASGGTGSRIVFADGSGSPQGHATVAADQGTPLGWIGDAEVSFVGGGRLRAVNRAGQVRLLSSTPIDAAHDRIDISPGGRYLYHAVGDSSAGQLIDLRTGRSHPLPGSSGDPAFSADGATVVWIDTSRGAPRLAIAASGGGPVLGTPLPVSAGDSISDLAVSPSGSRLVYSVTRSDGSSQLRLASLPDGTTLAVSTAGAGGSPNWSPTDDLFTVLGRAGGQPQIETVAVPAPDRQVALESTVTAFANAQVSGDTGAQSALAAPGAALPVPPHVTRSEVLWVLPSPDGSATARVRLTIDAGPSTPEVTQAEETLTVGPPSGNRPPVVRAVTIGSFGPAPGGPQLTHLDTDPQPGAVTLTFDSDLDPASAVSAITLSGPGGVQLNSAISYNPARRSVTLRPATPGGQPEVLHIGTGLRDVNGQHLSTALAVPITIG